MIATQIKSEEKSVAILLATYQGEKYLTEQLSSYLDQTHQYWAVYVSDDGSSDQTLEILNHYKNVFTKHPIKIFAGPQQGFAANFMSLICRQDIKADYYAFSDQDDIWSKDKLTRALNFLSEIPVDVPALYCGRTLLINKNKKSIGLSPLFHKPPSFLNALVQNIGGGNTMVLNHAAKKLIENLSQNISIVTHDWWAYILVCGCGGRVIYDPNPTVGYRQHGHNLVGMNNTWSARLRRIRMLLEGRFKIWNDIHIRALHSINHAMTPENQVALRKFSQARKMSLLPRLIHLKKSGVYRQTLLGNLGLIAGTLLGKI